MTTFQQDCTLLEVPGGSQDTTADQVLAGFLARGAGEILLRLQADAADFNLTGEKLKAAGDMAAQKFLDAALTRERPLDSVLSEEAVDTVSRLAADRVWIVDPLDGTREFSEGRDDWAVHVALWERGRLVAGAVALPGVGKMIGDGAPLPQAAPERTLRIAVSRSRPPEIASRVAQALGAELVPMGSAGYKIWAVTTGEVDAYLHAGGQYEWDSAAPVFAARGAGMYASRIDGSPLYYNQKSPYLPDLLVCRAEINDLLLNTIRGANAAIAEQIGTSRDGTLT